MTGSVCNEISGLEKSVGRLEAVISADVFLYSPKGTAFLCTGKISHKKIGKMPNFAKEPPHFSTHIWETFTKFR